jgi:hypothetical protein
LRRSHYNYVSELILRTAAGLTYGDLPFTGWSWCELRAAPATGDSLNYGEADRDRVNRLHRNSGHETLIHAREAIFPIARRRAETEIRYINSMVNQ